MYYKKKAKVRRVDEDLWAEIQELDSRDIIRIHQLHLRCVVPVCHSLIQKVGRDVIVVKPGELRKRTGVLIEYDTATNVGKIEVLEPVTNAKTTHMLKFGDFSKKHN